MAPRRRRRRMIPALCPPQARACASGAASLPCRSDAQNQGEGSAAERPQSGADPRATAGNTPDSGPRAGWRALERHRGNVVSFPVALQQRLDRLASLCHRFREWQGHRVEASIRPIPAPSGPGHRRVWQVFERPPRLSTDNVDPPGATPRARRHPAEPCGRLNASPVCDGLHRGGQLLSPSDFPQMRTLQRPMLLVMRSLNGHEPRLRRLSQFSATLNSPNSFIFLLNEKIRGAPRLHVSGGRRYDGGISSSVLQKRSGRGNDGSLGPHL